MNSKLYKCSICGTLLASHGLDLRGEDLDKAERIHEEYNTENRVVRIKGTCCGIKSEIYNY
jgi:hypothetical protein